MTRKAVPQFLMRRGTENERWSTKIAHVAISKEIQYATTDEMIIP
jgi:hypothetical protein